MKIKKLIIAILLIGCISMLPSYKDALNSISVYTESYENTNRSLTIILDAGHGGFDGGASSPNGVLEKDINLEIVKRIKYVAEKNNIKVLMTRDEDKALNDNYNLTIRGKKNEDMTNRKKLIDNSNANLALSIHLNSFPSDSSVRGAQVFYPSKKCSSENYEVNKRLSEDIQNSLEENIDDGKERFSMEKDDLFLFKNSKLPTILIECGFLSNSNDVVNLCKPTFQNKFAITVVESIKKTEYHAQPCG